MLIRPRPARRARGWRSAATARKTGFWGQTLVTVAEDLGVEGLSSRPRSCASTAAASGRGRRTCATRSRSARRCTCCAAAGSSLGRAAASAPRHTRGPRSEREEREDGGGGGSEARGDQARSSSSAGSSSSSRSSSTCTAGRARSSCRPRTSTTSSRTAPGSPASRPARSARCRATRTSRRSPTSTASRPCRGSRTWRASPATSRSRASRGRTARARSSARQLARAKELGYEFKLGHRARVLPRPQRTTTARSRSPTSSTRSRSPATTSPGLTRQLRVPHDRLALLQRARLGQLRERPRGRERPVRAELRRTPTRSSRADRAIFFRYMVHTLAEQHGMIATFMPKPFTHLTGNGCHFHMSLWRDGENVFLDEADPRGLGLSRARLQLHRRAQGARARLQRADRADRQLVQAAQARLDRERRHLVAGLDLVRLQQPHPDAAHPGRRAGSRTARSTAPRTRTSPRRRCSRRASTGSSAASTPGEPNSENLYAFSYDELDGARPADAAGEPARGDRRARAGRRAARGARPRARRGLRRLLRQASSATSGSATTSR